VGVDHDFLGVGLKKALYNYMHGIGLDADVRTWFDTRPAEHATTRRHGQRNAAASVPAPKVPGDLIARALLAR
jgi:hypothetical protein